MAIDEREIAADLMLDHARGVEYMSILEALPDDVEDQAAVAGRIADMISRADIDINLDPLDGEAAEYEQMEDAIKRVRALHTQYTHVVGDVSVRSCWECSEPEYGIAVVWPCATIQALNRHDTAAGTGILPAWSELSDPDKGAALMHLHKREWEGDEDATEHYPARFFTHPTLTSMSPREASEYAAGFEDVADNLDPDEWHRLYDLALDADRARRKGDSDE